MGGKMKEEVEKKEGLTVEQAARLQVTEGLAPEDSNGLGTLEFLNS
jgi:hypothetical protein